MSLKATNISTSAILEQQNLLNERERILQQQPSLLAATAWTTTTATTTPESSGRNLDTDLLKTKDKKTITAARNTTSLNKIIDSFVKRGFDFNKKPDYIFFISQLSRCYSQSYIEAICKRLRGRRYKNPLNKPERDALKRSLVQDAEDRRSNRSLKSDGVLMCDHWLLEAIVAESQETMRRTIEAFRLNAIRTTLMFVQQQQNNNIPTTTRLRFTVMSQLIRITGKRQSDLALLDKEKLKLLLDNKIIGIKIPKKNKLSRLSIVHENETNVEIIREIVELLQNLPQDILPYNVEKERKGMCREFDEAWNRVPNNNVKKPRQLGLHALRRMKGANELCNGKPMQDIQNMFDHTSREMTEHYVNNGLNQTPWWKYLAREINRGK